MSDDIWPPNPENISKMDIKANPFINFKHANLHFNTGVDAQAKIHRRYMLRLNQANANGVFAHLGKDPAIIPLRNRC